MFHVKYVSTSCNPCATNSFDWGCNDIVCFGSCNSVILWNTNVWPKGIPTSLVKHTDRVNAVCWVKNSENSPENELVSASCDGSAIYWKLKQNGEHLKQQEIIDTTDVCCQNLIGHRGSVNIVDAARFGNQFIVATGSADSTVKVWKEFEDQLKDSQTIQVTDGMCISIKLFQLRNYNINMLACSTTRNNINIYHEKTEFQLVHTLKGHESWIRDLDFTATKDGDILLSSCSQDTFIRVWKLSVRNENKNSIKTNTSEDNEIKPIEEYFVLDDVSISTTVECVISGHDNWVYSINWCKLNDSNQQLLLSCSSDKTVAIFQVDKDSCNWKEYTRFGEFGDTLPGFYGAKFSSDGKKVLAYDYNGAFHLWVFENDKWKQVPAIRGHFKEVNDIDWDSSGKYLLSVSADQTTRLHASWYHNNERKWSELARSQVHGYDLFCISCLGFGKYAAGAEEKVARVFQAPITFLKNYTNISQTKQLDYIFNDSEIIGATVPTLGLSNKATYRNDLDDSNLNFSNLSLNEITFEDLPIEEHLRQNTLWPEIQKLYGHGLEVFAMASTKSGDLLATSSKASKQNDAFIIVWDTKTWKQISKLYSHTLTITQLEFSPDETMLLSVSRDRRWTLFNKVTEENDVKFDLLASSTKENGIHSRIIWCCSWSPDSLYFSTGSRDGKIVIWTKNSEQNSQDEPSKIAPSNLFTSAGAYFEIKNESVTALCFLNEHFDSNYILSVGFDDGKISLVSWNALTFSWMSLFTTALHHKTIQRLKFNPILNHETVVLGSCSADHSVKIIEVSKAMLKSEILKA